MRVWVYGTGSVDGYFRGRLAQSGADVLFIARGEHLKALQRTGLRVESDKGDFCLKSVQSTGEPHDAGWMDVILVGVKACRKVRSPRCSMTSSPGDRQSWKIKMAQLFA